MTRSKLASGNGRAVPDASATVSPARRASARRSGRSTPRRTLGPDTCGPELVEELAAAAAEVEDPSVVGEFQGGEHLSEHASTFVVDGVVRRPFAVAVLVRVAGVRRTNAFDLVHVTSRSPVDGLRSGLDQGDA